MKGRIFRARLAATFIFLNVVAQPLLGAGQEELREELAAHIHFLSQPKLKGRKTRSRGAKLARQYIESEFKSFGLNPWGNETGYELSFGLGRNVVGILPGSDPHLSREIVLLSAHYDHLGKDAKGRICPGAADNASGVAVLLEAVRHFGLSKQPLKRTIAFAAFDAEEQMLLGSFAFCCRTDVESASIAAVVNVDMLGRDFLDVITNTIFVAGTEGYPGLQSRVRQMGDEANLRVLPLGSDLIGPRSDHVAFAARDIPCLFFSCGSFKDYHEAGDQAAKLNYDNIEKSARVILKSVSALANEELQPRLRADCDVQELKSVQTVLAELCRQPSKAGIQTNDLAALTRLKERVDELAGRGGYNPRTREILILEAARSLGRYLLPFGDQGPVAAQNAGWSYAIPYLEHIYLEHNRELLQAQKTLVAQVLKRPPSLFHGIAPYRYEIYDIPKDDISVECAGPDQYALHALGNDFELFVRGRPLIWLSGAFQLSFSGSFEALDCEGSRRELTDYCLLYFYAGGTNKVQMPAMRRVFSAASGTETSAGFSDLLRREVARGGFTSETEWLASCLASSNNSVTHVALSAVDHTQDPCVWAAVRALICNRAVRAGVRAHAIQVAMKHPDPATLLALSSVLDDSSPAFNRDDCPQFKPGYPLADRPVFYALRPLLENTFSHKVDTIGNMARNSLKKATRRDFGADVSKWRTYLEKRR